MILGIAAVLLFILTLFPLSHITDEQTSDSTVHQGNVSEANPQIKVGHQPKELVIDPDKNKVYVSNYESDTVSVIDGNSGNRPEIPVGSFPLHIGIDPNLHRVYVTNCGSNTVSVINDIRNARNITIGNNPSAIAVDSGTHKVYVTNSGSNTVSVIDPFSNTNIRNITVGSNPSYVAVDNITDKVYVTNSGSNTVSVIDPFSNTNIRNITVGSNPSYVAVDPFINKIYVSNALSGTVSVIDGNRNNTNIANITVGQLPSSIAVDDIIHKAYVIGAFSGAVSVIDGNNNTNPSNSGHITCDSIEVTTNLFAYIGSGTQCTAVPNKGFQFSSWLEQLGMKSSRTVTTSTISPNPLVDLILGAFGIHPKGTAANFTVTQFGNFTASFKEVSPPIPPEYWIPLYGVIVSSIVGWSIPSIIGGIKSRVQGRRINWYHERIKSLYDYGRINENDIGNLNELNTDITDAYAKGKITDEHYANLKNEISMSYEQVYNKEIDSINGNLDLLDKIKGK